MPRVVKCLILQISKDGKGEPNLGRISHFSVYSDMCGRVLLSGFPEVGKMSMSDSRCFVCFWFLVLGVFFINSHFPSLAGTKLVSRMLGFLPHSGDPTTTTTTTTSTWLDTFWCRRTQSWGLPNRVAGEALSQSLCWVPSVLLFPLPLSLSHIAFQLKYG